MKTIKTAEKLFNPEDGQRIKFLSAAHGIFFERWEDWQDPRNEIRLAWNCAFLLFCLGTLSAAMFYERSTAAARKDLKKLVEKYRDECEKFYDFWLAYYEYNDSVNEFSLYDFVDRVLRDDLKKVMNFGEFFDLSLKGIFFLLCSLEEIIEDCG
jgi:hypothetical protein